MNRSKSSSVLRNSLSRRKITVFGICLMLASLFWVMLAFNDHYSTKISVSVSYINMPENRMLIEKLPQTAEMLVNGSGYDLIPYIIRPNLANIIIDGRFIGVSASSKTGQAFVTTTSSIDFFNREHFDIKALNIFPDTIFFSFFEHGLKKVPVHLNRYFTYDRQYSLSDSVILQPDSILISGPFASLDSIKRIETEPLILNKLNKSGDYSVKIKKTSKLITYAPMEIGVHLEVDKFTEAEIEVPIYIEHLTNGDSVDIFPKQAKITYLVSLQNYNKVNPKLFRISADAFDIRNSKNANLRLDIKQFPSFVQGIRIEPETVEFIIRKNK
jgi:YbbR domain-containing protein